MSALNNNESFTPVALTASSLVKKGQGLIGGFLCANTGGGTITIYDNAVGDTSGQKIMDTVTPVAGTPYPLPASFQTGLSVIISGSLSVTMLYN